MSTSRRPRARRAFVLFVVVMTAFVVLSGVLIMARLALLEVVRERENALATCAEQMIASAREWTRIQPAALSPGAPCELPAESLLPSGCSGTIGLEVYRARSGIAVVRCEVTLERRGKRLRRVAEWPLVLGSDAMVTRL